MKKEIFDNTNQYIKESDWKDITLLKFCVLSLGILIGFCVPKKCRKKVGICCSIVFLGTYVPQILKLGRIISDNQETEDATELYQQ